MLDPKKEFLSTHFSYHAGYLNYHPEPFITPNGHIVLGCHSARFVARFKWNRGSKAKFKKFLMKNFTPDEYFSRLDAGETPLAILKSKGFRS